MNATDPTPLAPSGDRVVGAGAGATKVALIESEQSFDEIRKRLDLQMLDAMKWVVLPGPMIAFGLAIQNWSLEPARPWALVAVTGSLLTLGASHVKRLGHSRRTQGAVYGSMLLAIPGLLAFGPTMGVGLLFLYSTSLSGWFFSKRQATLVAAILCTVLALGAVAAGQRWVIVPGLSTWDWWRIAAVSTFSLIAFATGVRRVREIHDGLLIAKHEALIALRGTSDRLYERNAALEQASASLEERESRFRQLVDHISDAVLVDDLAGNVQFANDRFLDLFGFSRERVTTLTLDDYVAPAWRAPIRALRERRDDLSQYEFEGLRSDGETRWIELNLVPIIVPEQGVVGFQSALRDVTERKLTMASLKASQQLFEGLIAASPVGVFLADSQGNRLFVNSTWSQITGISAEAALHIGWTEGLHPDDRETVLTELRAATQENRAFSLEYRFVHPDGRQRWVLGQMAPLGTHSKLGGGHIGTITDITPLREANARSAALLAAQPDGMYVIDANDRFVDVHTEGSVKDFSSPSFVLNKLFSQVLPPDLARKLRDLCQRTRETGRLCEAEYSVEIRGELRHREVRSVPYLDGTLLLIRDVTERKRAEVELAEREEFLRLSQQIAHVGSWDWDIHRNKLVWSDEMYRLHGRDPNEYSPTLQSALEHCPPGDREKLLEGLQKTLATGWVSPGTIRIMLPGGEQRTHRLSWKTYFDEAGTPYRIVGVSWDITEQEDQEKNLKLSTHAIEHAVDAFHLLSTTGHLLNVNQASCRLLGYSREQLLKMHVSDIDPTFKASDWEYHWSVLRDKGMLSFETILRRSDGSMVPVEIALSHLSFEGQQYLSSAIRDISDRKRAYQALRASQAHYQSLFDEALEGVFRTTRDGKFVDVNPAFVRLTGYDSKEEMLGVSSLDLYSMPSERDRMLERYRGVEQINNVETWWRRKSGERILVELSGRILPHEDGQAIQFQGFIRDITEVRARADRERALLEHKEQLELVLEGTRLGFWDWNPQNNELVVSERWAEMLGYSPGELAPTMSGCRELIHPDDRAHWEEQLLAHLRGETPYFEAVHRMQHRDGHWVHILNRGKVFTRDSVGQPVRFCGTHTDITTEKVAEQAAVAANNAKTLFLANMSHELRTPLNAVLGLSEALLSGAYGDLSDKQQRSLRTIHGSGRHLLDLINDVLDIARVEAGQLVIDLRNVALSAVLGECFAVLQETAELKGQRMSSQIDPSVTLIRTDPRKLKQVLLNLLSNALKFSPPGSSVVVGATRNESEPNRVSIWVDDEGPGVSTSDRERIFEPFVSLDPSFTREHGGAGLGLALVKRIVTLHGGTVSVESRSGPGSRFLVKLPDPPTHTTVTIPGLGLSRHGGPVAPITRRAAPDRRVSRHRA